MRSLIPSTFALACAAVGLLAARGRAEMGAATPERYFAAYARQIPQVDGKLDEWQAAWPGAVKASAADAARKGLATGTATAADEKNYRVEVAFQWDDRHLFVGARVWDDQLVAVQRDEKGLIKSPWAFDTLLVRLSAFGQPSATGRYAEKLTLDIPQPCPTFGFSYHAPGGEGFPQRPGVEYVCGTWERGYTVEAVVPFAVCGYDVRAGDRLRFCLELVDHDPSARVGQMLWRCWTGYGAPVNVTDERAAWPQLRLLDESGWGGDILLDKALYAAGESLRLFFDADSRQRPAALQRLGIIDASGATKRSVIHSAQLKPDAPMSVTAELSLKELPPGAYRVIAEATLDGGIAKRVEADFAIAKRSVAEGASSLPKSQRFVEDPCRYFQVAALQYPPPREITKQDYVDWLRTTFERFTASVHRTVHKRAGMPTSEFVLACAALYDATGEEKYFNDTLQSFKSFRAGLGDITKPIYVNGAHFAYFLWAWDVLQKHKRVTAEDEAMFKEILRVGIPKSLYASTPQERERDPGNRGLSRGAVLGATAHLVPDLPQAADWKDYAQKVWNDWWPYRDTCENTSGYNGYWLTILLGYVHAIGFEDEFYRDEAVKRLMERFLYQQSPSGLRPSYGDTGGAVNGGAYVGILELLAVKFRDGRYKWAARRSFDHFTRCMMDDYYNYWNTWQGMYASVAMAIIFGDEALKPVPSGGESRVTHRKYMEPLSPSARQKELRYWYLRDRVIPDKLILSSGNRFEDLWAMVDLCPFAGHGHPAASAFVFLTVHGSTLLCDESYTDKAPKYHNLVLVEDLQGIQPVQEEERIEVPVLDERKETTFARVEVQNYKQFPVKQAREVFFLKNRFIWVRDTVSFDQPFLCRVGPQWRARQIGPGVGENYAVTFLDIVSSAWWGKGRQAERSNRFLNPNWNLLVYFLPRPGCAMAIGDESAESLWRNAPQPIQYQWRGLGQPERPLRFDSLLYPHHPTPDPDSVVKQIQVVHEDGDAVALRADFTLWRKGPFPNLQRTAETIWAALNPSGKPLKAGELETDAQRLYLRLEQGQPKHLYAAAATHVRLAGSALHASKEPQDVDR